MYGRKCVPKPNEVRGFFSLSCTFFCWCRVPFICVFIPTFLLSYRKKTTKWKWKALSCVWLFVTPWTIPVHGIYRTINQFQQVGSASGGVFVKQFNVTNFPFLRQLAAEGYSVAAISFCRYLGLQWPGPILSKAVYKVNVSRQTGPHCSGMLLKVN